MFNGTPEAENKFRAAALTQLGIDLYDTGRFKAEKAFDLGVKNTPDDYRVYYNFACYWAERGNEAACRNYLGLTLELAPASFGGNPAQDPDLARYSRQEWFTELLAAHKTRAATWEPGD